MDLVLAGLQWSNCLVYLDDVNVLGKGFDEHLQNLQAVFRRFKEAGQKVQPAKCAFFQHQVQYLGHNISTGGVAADPAKVEKVASWPTPTSTREIQQFLGLANYYRRFIRNARGHFALFASLRRSSHPSLEEFRGNSLCSYSIRGINSQVRWFQLSPCANHVLGTGPFPSRCFSPPRAMPPVFRGKDSSRAPPAGSHYACGSGSQRFNRILLSRRDLHRNTSDIRDS